MKRPAALVLTAGLGTRLRPLTDVRAKAAVPVNGDPLARRVAYWLASSGFDNQVYNLHHHPATITACLGDGSELGIRIRYSWEQPVLGSAGGPRRALPLLMDGGSTRFLIVNGDTLTNVDVDGLLSWHAESGALVTMAVIPNPAPERYGGVSVTNRGFVSGFTRPGADRESYHFIGVQVAEAEAFKSLPDGIPHESVNALYPMLMHRNRDSVAAFVSHAGFRDIGRPADLFETSISLIPEEGNRLVSTGAQIAEDAVVERTALWDDVIVERRARLVDCIVADRVRISAGMSLARCAIVPAGSRSPVHDERVENGLLIRPF